jgi:hypothetical protein
LFQIKVHAPRLPGPIKVLKMKLGGINDFVDYRTAWNLQNFIAIN